MSVELRPYQRASLDAITRELRAGVFRQLVKKPTGTGKTVTFAELLKQGEIAAWLAEHEPSTNARVLVIAHREELLDQSAEKFRRQNPGLLVSIEQGDRHASTYGDVIVASIQTLAAQNYRRLDRLLKRCTFRIVIVDEAHHAAAATYRTVLARLGFLPSDGNEAGAGNVEAATWDDVKLMTEALKGWDERAPRDRLLLGFTATPNRTDAIGLGCVFQKIVYNYELKQAIDDGWLTPPVPWVIETAENLDEVRTARGDFNQKDLAKAVNQERRNILAVEAVQRYAPGRSTIAFTVDVQHAHDLAAIFRAKGISAAAVSGETDKEERRAILRDYSAGRIQVICNCMVLTEGTDLPITSCILHTKPTKSATLYEQMTGRGLRLFPGKRDCVVIDVVDVTRKHSLQTTPILFGLPPGLKGNGEDPRGLADALERLREKFPLVDIEKLLAEHRLTIAQLEDRASTFDVWTVPSLGDVGRGLTCQWIKTGATDYRLQYPWGDGQEILQVSRNVLGHFDLSITLRPANGQPTRQRTLGTEIPEAHAALIIAEAFMHQERNEVLRLKKHDAPWRRKPATDKQRAMLRGLGVLPHANDPRLTAGRASELIDLAKARRR